jgi:nucleoside-diphosphate-sugar epimerase
MLIFGLGYSAKRVRDALETRGWQVSATGADAGLAFNDEPAVRRALAEASHVLSSVPPGADGDPVLERYGDALGRGWLGYLSSTGVYGDAAGAWVDESAPVGTGRRSARTRADAAWLERGARVFRLPGIYGPGRSALDRVREGRAHRIDLPNQVFSRIHVDDLMRGVLAALDAPAGAYNLADDVPTSQNAVIEEACRLLGMAVPPMLSLDKAALSPAARAFYAENRRVANGKARRVFGWRPRYRDFRAGLHACRLA